MRRGTWTLPALAVASALAAGAPSRAAPGCEALARFDASCASCHEAECSGRLTFADPSTARAHVERHAGPLRDEEVAELIELLRVTKETCRLDAAAADRCGRPPWDAAGLRRLRARSGRAWLVPLGTPAAGPARVALRFDRDARARLRISTARFDVLHESATPTREGALEAEFAAPGGETLFLRVQTELDAELLELAVDAGPAPR